MSRVSLIAALVAILAFASLASANVVELTDSNFGDLVGTGRPHAALGKGFEGL
jgi:hypothetical protein